MNELVKYGLTYALPSVAAPLAYNVITGAMNPDAPEDRFDRQVVNAIGGQIGASSGYVLSGLGKSPNPYIRAAATAAGALGGGYLSDRIANLVDASGGKVEAIDLLNASLEPQPINPIQEQAEYRERIRQSRMQQKEMERQAMLQYQAEMSRQQVYGQ